MVKKIKWKDFEIADLQPNLIPNGWDSFEPYGSGKNYVENWNFESDDLGQINRGAVDIKKLPTSILVRNSTNVAYAPIWYKNINYIGDVVLRMKVRSSDGIYIRSLQGTNRVEKCFAKSNEYQVVELRYTITDLENMVYIYDGDTQGGGKLDQTFEIDWIQITPVDNQHLVVEKTPIGNGLTRIQTWGGNHRDKLRFHLVDRPNNKLLFNSYVENNRNNEVYLAKCDGAGHFEYIKPYEEKFITIELNGNASIYEVKVGTRTDKNSNLDFIASEPQIVEGDKHNPVLVVDQLDDGTEHVRVYGAYHDTKLVYKGGGAIIGEPYVIESEIENLGGQLQMETTLDSTGQVIDKGINQVNIKGTTDSKDFEIGVKLRDGTI